MLDWASEKPLHEHTTSCGLVCSWTAAPWWAPAATRMSTSVSAVAVSKSITGPVAGLVLSMRTAFVVMEADLPAPFVAVTRTLYVLPAVSDKPVHVTVTASLPVHDASRVCTAVDGLAVSMSASVQERMSLSGSTNPFQRTLSRSALDWTRWATSFAAEVGHESQSVGVQRAESTCITHRVARAPVTVGAVASEAKMADHTFLVRPTALVTVTLSAYQLPLMIFPKEVDATLASSWPAVMAVEL